MPLRQPPARTARHAQATRPRHGRTATTTLTVLGLALGGGLGLVLPAPASADPAPAAATSAFAVGDTVAGTVPDGVCSVVATVVGGAGGRSAAGAGGVGSNGAGAAITATFDVLPGTAFSGSVGGGGRANVRAAGGAGGVGGGGAGGTAAEEHGGAGGGGLSLLRLGGTDDDAIAVLAGGGGGSGGGHSVTTDGFGGDAGLPAAPGQVAPGADGTDGFEGGPTVGGGKGGGTTAPGAGGTHPTASLAGLPGVGRTGGAGAPDPNYDAGGGGGAGVFGAGGGASTTIKNQDNGLTTVAGGGGGGGSSVVAATARDVTSTAAGRQTGTGNGANGSITLDWVECAYDLAVTKTAVVDGAPAASPDLAPVGSTITWTVTVRNAGPQAMTRGDVVVLRDTLPGAGATFASATVTGGGSEQLERGPVVCDATPGAAMPAALTCARPFAPLGGAADGVRGLDVDETLTVVYTQQVTDAPGTELTNVASVVDRGDQDDNTATSTVTVIGPPVATDDEDRGNRIGDPVTVPVLGNDSAPSGDLDPASVVLWDADRGVSLGTELVVPGEGTWTVDTTTGALTFTPEAGFLVDPTPVAYRVSDTHGQTATAVVVVTYLPEAADDSSLGHAIGSTVTVDVLANDTGDLDAASVRLVDGEERVTRLVVPGEGTWSVDPTTGEVTFTPEDGFLVDPTPVTYEVTDSTGDTVAATVTVGYVPDATDDADLDNPLGTAVTVDVLGNDTGDLDPTTVRLVDGDRQVTTLEVPGQGTWTVDPTTGAVTFTPQDGYVGNPTPVRYVVTDSTGDTTGAQVTVTYQPEATDDARHGNELGRPVVLDPLGNDAGDLDPATLRIVDPATGDRVTTLRVPGEGTWTVDPTTGEVTFTPQDGYDGNPTPQRYEVSDAAGGTTGARLVVTFLPQAADDVDEGNVRGTAVTVDVVGNDRGTLDPTSVRLLDADGEPVTTLVVDGEGTWTVDPTTGAVTFTPAAGFGGDPTPVRYRVSDVEGNPTEALVRVTYVDAPAGPTPAPTPTPTATPAPTPDLAVTGWGGWGVAALAGLLLVAGAGALVLRRPTTR
ncbi:DUF11 domain-containing protein [Cellulomonas sp. HD19AZ1]|uniref:Ig-like domain-containing protein n=1 Tax=Cellulomonas sp. HD19AZ1 TaxID=2559593 RepID=UPI001070A77B|nr:DUF11 domain-containing protein [Cellulomonas sp. HD19AZ1]TFH71295.1 hypothetical protein E4A51_10690 [Cellulomonas sp. HD19AZ1]